MKKTLNPVLCCLFLSLLSMSVILSGCPWDKKQGDLSGWVSDAAGKMLPLVRVTLSNGASTHTDSHGLFVFENIEAQKAYALSFSLKGYAAAARRVWVRDQQLVSLKQQLVPLDAGQAFSGNAGRVTDEAGNSIVFGADSLGSAQKADAVAVHVSAVDFSVEGGVESAPGSLEATLNASGDRGWLEAESLVHYEVSGANEEAIDLAASVTITLLLPEDTVYAEGDAVPLWRFESARGLWVEGPTGTVILGEDDRLYISAEVAYLGWWCCAQVIANAHTFRGVLYDENNAPLAGAIIRAIGLDYGGLSYAQSDADGAYSLSVKAESRVRLELIPPGAWQAVSTSVVSTGAAGQTTRFNMTLDYTSCIAGYLTTSSGAAIEGVTVFSSCGGSAVSDKNGYFCLGVPGDTLVAVYAPGRPPRLVLSPAAASCGDADLELITLAIPYPEDGDIVGRVFHHIGSFGESAVHSATAIFCSGVDGEEYAAYREQQPTEDHFKIYTKYFDLDVHSTLGLDAWFDASFSSEGDATGLLADMDFAFNGLFSANVSTSEDGAVPENGDELEFGRIGGLDAGETATVGFDAASLPLYSLNAYLDGRVGPYAALGCYGQEPPFAENAFFPGETVNFSWPGGLDLGAFTLENTLPAHLVLTAPVLTDVKNIFEPEEATGLIPDLTLTWEAENPSSYVTLFLETIALDTFTEIGLASQFHYRIEFGALVCRLVDDGECTIPGATLAELVDLAPTSEKSLTISTSTRLNFLLGLRTAVSENNSVPLLRTEEGAGRVIAFATSDPLFMWNVNFDAAVAWE